MYINDVIKDCDRLCPNEYSTEEKYLWIDELNATISQEVLKKYAKVTVEPNLDGEFVLPEGVTFEMIDRFIVGGREIDKVDYRSFGIQYLYGKRGRYIRFTRDIPRESIDVVYLIPPNKIDIYSLDGSYPSAHSVTDVVHFDNTHIVDDDTVEVDGCLIAKGDVVDLEVTINDGSTEQKRTIKDVLIIGFERFETINMGGGTPTLLVVNIGFTEGTLSGINTANISNIKMTKVLLDETIPPAPYDTMYIEWLCAKIMYYQRDFRSYNQFMQTFKDKMAAYKKWLFKRSPTDKDGRTINWW